MFDMEGKRVYNIISLYGDSQIPLCDNVGTVLIFLSVSTFVITGADNEI